MRLSLGIGASYFRGLTVSTSLHTGISTCVYHHGVVTHKICEKIFLLTDMENNADSWIKNQEGSCRNSTDEFLQTENFESW